MQGLDPKLTQNLLVVIGIFLGVMLFKDVLKTILPLLSPKKNSNNGKENPSLAVLLANVRQLIRKVDELYEWHNCKDDDGVFLWYTRRSMYDVLDKLVAILQEIREDQRETRRAVDNIAKRGE